LEDYTTHNSAPKVCGVHILKPEFDQQLSRTEEEPEEDKATLLDTLKEPYAARKHMYKQKYFIFKKLLVRLQLHYY